MSPHEVDLGGVLVSPLLLAGLLGLAAAWLTASLMSRYRLTRFFSNPPLVFVALTVIYGGLISFFVIRA